MPGTRRKSSRLDLRAKINILFEQIATEFASDNPPSREGITNEQLGNYGIRCMPFDFSIDEHFPEVLLRPLSPSVLKDHPIDHKKLACPINFRDYNPPTDSKAPDRASWEPKDCAMFVHRYLNAWTGIGFLRTGVKESLRQLPGLCGIELVYFQLSLFTSLLSDY